MGHEQDKPMNVMQDTQKMWVYSNKEENDPEEENKRKQRRKQERRPCLFCTRFGNEGINSMGGYYTSK